MNLNPIRLARAIYRHFRRESLDDDERKAIMTVGMIFIYFAIITPLALLQRLRGRGQISNPSSGWIAIDESTSDLAEYDKSL